MTLGEAAPSQELRRLALRGGMQNQPAFEHAAGRQDVGRELQRVVVLVMPAHLQALEPPAQLRQLVLQIGLGVDRVLQRDRKSTRLNSSHQIISYAVFCLKKKSLPERPVTHCSDHSLR